MTSPTLLVSVEGAVARLTLNRPEVRNAIDREMVAAMHRALDELDARQDVAALVLCGAGGRAFAGGADIAQLRERRSAEALLAINARLFQRVEEFPVPTVAAITGFALGG